MRELGERDLAIEQLNLVASKPNGPPYGWLRLSPFWDPLRGDPRFEKIVASLAPKDAGPDRRNDLLGGVACFRLDGGDAQLGN